jgi:transposase-like protein
LLDTTNNWRCSFYDKKIFLETKLSAANVYLDGVESIREIAKKFSISKTMFHRWLGKFEKHCAKGPIPSALLSLLSSFQIGTLKMKILKNVLDSVQNTR